MNGMVDSRVVEMHFDNSDFMDKIEETIEALERLNDQISNINAAQGLSNLTAGADIGLSNVEDSLGNIESRFSILGIVGMTIVQRLTNAAIDGVTKVANLLGAAARQARTGGFIRAENIEQAKFLLEGLGADVEGVFDRVDKAVTGTSYGIDEAAKAASSFYASGITDLDKMQDALRAVAGVAAMTGSDYASIADIFTTVAGQGKVMTMQLRMMEGRGLNAAATMRDFFNKAAQNSEKFRKDFGDNVADSVQKLTGGTKVSEETIREFVNKGKIDFEVFSAAMDNAFGKHAQEANKTFSGSLANLKTSLSRLGEAFYTPAMKAAIPVFNSLREVFSKLTTDLKSSKLSQEIDRISKSIEKSGKLTFITDRMFEAAGINIYPKLTDYLNGVNDGSVKASKSMQKFVKEITNGEQLIDEQTVDLIARGKISFKLFNAALGDYLKSTKKLHDSTSFVTLFTTSVDSLSKSLDGAIKRFKDSKIITNISDSISNTFLALSVAWHAVQAAFKEVFPGSAIASMEKFSEKLKELTAVLYNKMLYGGGWQTIQNIMVGFFSGVKAGINIISGLFSVLKSGIGVIFRATGAFEGFSKGFRDSMQRINEKTGTIGVFEKLANVLDGLGKLADRAFKKIARGFGTIVKTMAEGLGNVQNLTQAFVSFGLVLGGLSAMKNYKIIKYRLGLITGGIGRFIQMLRIADLQDTGSAIKDILDSSKRALAGFTHEIKTKILKDLAFSILALAVGLKLLETVDASRLAAGLGALTVMMAEMTGVLLVILNLLNDSTLTGSMKGVLAIGGISNAMIKLAISMLIMAEALKMISELDPAELATGLAGLTVMLGAVLGFILLLDKYQEYATDKTVGLMLLGVATSLLIMAKAVQILSSLKPIELAKGLGSVVVLLGAVFGFLAGLSKLEVTMGPGLIAAGVGMIAIAAAINILAPALERIGAIPLEQLSNSLQAVIAAMVAMAVASDMASLSGGAGMFMMALAISSLATSLERISSLNVSEISKGFITIAIALGIMVAATAILSIFSETLLIVAGAMLMFSGSVALFGAGLVLIGTGLTTISAGIMSFAAVTVTSIETFIQAIKVMIVEFCKAIPEILEASLSSLSEIIRVLNEYTPEIIAFLTKLLDMLIELITEYLPKLVSTGVELGIMLLLGILKGIAKSISDIVKAGIDVVVGFIEGVAANLDQVIQAGFDLIVAFINGLANGIRDNTEAIKGAITNLCSAILEAFMSFFGIASPSTVMQEQGVNLMQGLLNGIKSFGGIPAALISAVKGGLSRIGAFAGKFKSKGSELIRSIGTGIKSRASDIKVRVGDAITKAKNKVGEYVGKFKNAGGDLISGVAKGIRNGVSSVISAAGSIAQRALNKFKSKLGISSPSKVFAEAASWIPEGIAVGIKKTTRSVDKAVSNLSDRTVSPIEDAFAKIASFANFNDDFTPTITPVLDLSEVRKGASGIGSIFGNESVSLAASIGPNDVQNLQNNNLMNQLLTKMDKIMTSDSNPTNITNHFTVNGNDNPEQFVNTFIRTLDREMKMRAV